MQFEQSASHSAHRQKSQSEVIHQSLDHLLAMAHRYRSEGNVWQAIEMYWMLSDDHAGTAQSLEAEKSLLELAETYEHDAQHMARALYERLSDLDGVTVGREAVVYGQRSFPE